MVAMPGMQAARLLANATAPPDETMSPIVGRAETATSCTVHKYLLNRQATSPSYGELMRFSISIPQLHDGAFDGAALRSYLRRAEELGFEGGWTLEQTIGPGPLIAPLELLAYAAAATERLRLGVAVLITSLHDPLQLASIATAVDRLSGGRLDLGVAPGGGFRQFDAFGVDGSTFVSSFTEGLELMKAAWSDKPTVTFHGRFRTVEDVTVVPKPVQRPHPPLWFGGHAPKALARAVRLGDAFIGAGSSTIAGFAEVAAGVRDELDRQHKDPTRFTIAKRMYLIVDDDEARARARVLTGLNRIYGPRSDNADIAVSGTPAQIADAVGAVIAAGAQMVLLNPVGAGIAEDREQLERLAADVIPQFS
jgi:alkanesulfonate monooxygenase SsuD/methylene tetrahydromethanopterin reductase-like flavin-dependent oxidoreductase (luciferase family)